MRGRALTMMMALQPRPSEQRGVKAPKSFQKSFQKFSKVLFSIQRHSKLGMSINGLFFSFFSFSSISEVLTFESDGTNSETIFQST